MENLEELLNKYAEIVNCKNGLNLDLKEDIIEKIKNIINVDKPVINFVKKTERQIKKEKYERYYANLEKYLNELLILCKKNITINEESFKISISLEEKDTSYNIIRIYININEKTGQLTIDLSAMEEQKDEISEEKIIKDIIDVIIFKCKRIQDFANKQIDILNNFNENIF